jgi:hypothetical protein
MDTDLNSIPNESHVTLHPNSSNPLHKKPVRAFFVDGYFYCDGTPPDQGPDYYFRDVLQFNDGWTIEQ